MSEQKAGTFLIHFDGNGPKTQVYLHLDTTCTDAVEAFAGFLRGIGYLEGNIADALQNAYEQSLEYIRLAAEDHVRFSSERNNQGDSYEEYENWLKRQAS